MLLKLSERFLFCTHGQLYQLDVGLAFHEMLCKCHSRVGTASVSSNVLLVQLDQEALELSVVLALVFCRFLRPLGNHV